jgi:virginiamycin A acetyltransferase
MIVFKGKRLLLNNFLLRFKNVKDKTGIFISKGSRIVCRRTQIGDGSRINGPITIKGKGSCNIGKYVAFGYNIRLITSNHETSEVILQYNLSKQLGIKPKTGSKIDINIGHNVWIGDNVIITPGVSVANGAIIGAGSVVTKNVPPYAIFAGVPAKLIRYRFEDDRINEIEKLLWWDWSFEKMKNNIEKFRN